jgi:hypothetical protein
MSLSHIQPLSSQSPALRESEMRRTDVGKAREAAPAMGAPLLADQVLLGRQTAAVDLQRILVERVMTRTEMETAAATRELLAAAGKAEFERRGAAAATSDTSPEATAMRIVEGATGYIFKAFRLRHRRITEADLAKFRSQVLRGFEAGLEDAKDIFAGLQAMTADMERWVTQTEARARQYLDRFFADVLAAVQKLPADPQPMS